MPFMVLKTEPSIILLEEELLNEITKQKCQSIWSVSITYTETLIYFRRTEMKRSEWHDIIYLVWLFGLVACVTIWWP